MNTPSKFDPQPPGYLFLLMIAIQRPVPDFFFPKGNYVAAQVTVAYEPVWAIGTGRVPSADDVSAMHRAIRAQLLALFAADGAGVRILYGGSVNSGNAVELLHCDEVGGALVGGASLTAESFLAIIAAAAPDQG